MEYYNIINKRYFEVAKSNSICPMFKIELLDSFENVVDVLSQEISTSQSGQISINYQQGVRRSCSLTFIDNEGRFIPTKENDIIWTDKKFKVYSGLKDISNGDVFWFSQGVFYYKTASSTRNGADKVTSIQGVDKFAVFTSDLGTNQITDIYHIPAGSNIYNAIRTILRTDFGNGMIVDNKEPIFDIKYTREVTPYDITKSPQSYMGDMIKELAYILGCNIFYDTEGRLNITSGTTDVNYNNESSIWDFSDNDYEYLNSTVNVDFTKFINRVVVVGNNINDTIHTYTAVNDNPNSPTRVGLNPIRNQYITTSIAYNDDRAKDYAIFELNRLSILQLSTSITSTILPHLDVNKIITLEDSYYKFERERFIIQSLTIPLVYSSTMSMTATNVATLPYYEENF